MSGWEVGDLALCVEVAEDAATWVLGKRTIGLGPIKGLTYTVSSVCTGKDCYGRKGTALQFYEIGCSLEGSIGYNAACFRKVTPGAEIEGVEERRRIPVREDA